MAEDLRIFLRLWTGGRKFGPGKAELLERIGALGSISAAGREMGMSYKRAWSLVEDMNAMFARPLVVPARGGAGGGGAQLTAEGARVAALFRALEARLAEAGAAELAEWRALLPDMSDET
ncbi:MAG: LysR family transcriptional regulator [Gemmobacter sp.]|uniref:winged helix-turn-helix domain-containing protein n=1 Tax=Gemmobacter sp. TaxID=1898957 RepID=UPI001A37987E|nr:LysR family transcriptional regulator [Gemmobacter sp.]MBL8563971.1 LysR family transcriptional regulator [Gemmobacter sp.]